MKISLGIVGLPNVGKSTFFNALAETGEALVANYPFCTIEPNHGLFSKEDELLINLAKVASSKKILPAVAEIVDIAGIVRNAYKGQGLGNQFLAHIREVDLVMLILRDFDDPLVSHSEALVNPLNDLEVLLLELIFADLETLKKALEKAREQAKSQEKEALFRKQLLERLKAGLEAEKLILAQNLQEEEWAILRSYNFLTAKPFIFLVNTNEKDLSQKQKLAFGDFLRVYSASNQQREFLLKNISSKEPFIYFSGKILAEIKKLPKEEQEQFKREFNITEIKPLIWQELFEKLELINFFTINENEARAHLAPKGINAWQAAGYVHSDFQKKFLFAEVVSAKNFLASGGWQGARAKGKTRREGKDYILQDEEIIFFHNHP